MTFDEVTQAFAEGANDILKENLVGVYLHGSAVMDCYNPEKSDIDLLVVVEEKPTDEVKRAFMDMVFSLNAQGPKKGIEMSVVKREVCDPFVYPTPFELHFSVGHIDWYRNDPDGYIQKMNGQDKDLAAHFTILRKRGRCLCGLPIRDVFAEVPRKDYLDSIWYDIENASDEILDNPMYLILNLARVLAYCSEGLVLSKKEGGVWALENLPQEYLILIQAALREYTENESVSYDPVCSKQYADFMLSRIRPYL